MQELAVYKQSILFVKKTTIFLSQHRMPYIQILSDQLMRAVLSIPLNISEGYGLSINMWKKHLRIASGSTNEVHTIYEVIQQTFDIDTSEFRAECLYIGKRLTLLRKKTVKSNL